MNNNDLKLFAATLRADLLTLDLHGCHLDQAREEIDLFLSRALVRGETVAKIIYGGGTGRLRDVVVGYLQTNQLVATIEEQGGHCLILLT